MSSLAANSRSWHEHETSVLQLWAKQICKNSDYLQGCFVESSTVQRLRAMIQHPMAWLNQIFLLTLPVSEVFISFQRTNDSLCRCLGLQVKYFIVLTGRRKKNKCPVPTQILPNQREVMCSLFYRLCDMKSFSVAFCEMPFYIMHLQCSILCLPAVFNYNVTSKTLLFI